MHHFQYKGDELYCEDVPVRLIAEKIGTPCYIYSHATLSHHHGVGRMFAPWLERHLGPEQMAVLRALKAHFDPDGIMNPGGVLGLDRPAAGPGGSAGN